MTRQTHIPEKEYFRIGEVTEITGVKDHTLRYWENEFKLLRPEKRAGRRYYRRSDVELVNQIKDLLYNKRYTIEGVKKFLLADKRKKQLEFGVKEDTLPDSKILREIKEELKKVLELLKS